MLHHLFVNERKNPNEPDFFVEGSSLDVTSQVRAHMKSTRVRNIRSLFSLFLLLFYPIEWSTKFAFVSVTKISFSETLFLWRITCLHIAECLRKIISYMWLWFYLIWTVWSVQRNGDEKQSSQLPKAERYLSVWWRCARRQKKSEKL